MSWIPKTYNAHCCLCEAPISVDFLNLTDIFAEKAFVVTAHPRVLLDEKKEKTSVDINLLCESCKGQFGITISPERKDKEDFAAPELDPRAVAAQFPSFNVRNDSNRFWIRIWADKEIPSIGRDFRVAPGETKYITGCWLAWLQFVTVTDPTVTNMTTGSPYIIDIFFWDDDKGQMAPGYPKTLWPQFTDGPKQISINMDVNDKLLFVFTPFWTRLLKDKLVEPKDLATLTLAKANQLLTKSY